MVAMYDAERGSTVAFEMSVFHKLVGKNTAQALPLPVLVDVVAPLDALPVAEGPVAVDVTPVVGAPEPVVAPVALVADGPVGPADALPPEFAVPEPPFVPHAAATKTDIASTRPPDVERSMTLIVACGDRSAKAATLSRWRGDLSSVPSAAIR
jgi:hypothetical protein